MLLTLKSICKSYPSPNQRHNKTVFTNLSLNLASGENISIMGPSGSGKTTLLNIIGMLDRPDSGDYIFNGKNISDYSEREMTFFRNQEIGFIFQKHYLLPQCSLLDNVLIPTLELRKREAKQESLERAKSLMKTLGIWDIHKQYPSEASLGECQRAAVARALINQPGLLLADEPTGALDYDNSRKLAKLLFSINRSQRTALILVTHDAKIAALADKQYYLQNQIFLTANNSE